MDNVGAAGLLANACFAAPPHVTVAKTELVRGTGEDSQVKVGTWLLHRVSVITVNAEDESKLANINSLSSSDENISRAGSSEESIKPNDRAFEATTPEVGSIAARNIPPVEPEPEHASGNWIPGGLYAAFDHDAYTCFKVLAVDDEVLHIKPFYTRYEQLPSAQECKEQDDLSKRVLEGVFRVDESLENSLPDDDSSDCQCSDCLYYSDYSDYSDCSDFSDCSDCSDGPLGISVGPMPLVQESGEQDDLPKCVVQDSPQADESSEDSLADDDFPVCQCSGGLLGTFVGYMPMARNHFKGKNAQLIVTTSIIDCELVGYREWQDSNRGYFL